MSAHDEAYAAERIGSVKNWYHRIEVRPGVFTPGVNETAAVLRLLDLPADLTGKRVLDLGTRDGFFAFETARRGAAVVAVDYLASDQTGFKVAAELLSADVTYTDAATRPVSPPRAADPRGGQITYVQENIYNLSAGQHGTFDVVLCLGLLYHLPDPLHALRILRELCHDALYLETHVIDEALLRPDGTFVPMRALAAELPEIPLMQFFPGDALNNDFTNYWAPNLRCMELMLRESNFAVLETIPNGHRGIFKCRAGDNAQLKYFMDVATGALRPA